MLCTMLCLRRPFEAGDCSRIFFSSPSKLRQRMYLAGDRTTGGVPPSHTRESLDMAAFLKLSRRVQLCSAAELHKQHKQDSHEWLTRPSSAI